MSNSISISVITLTQTIVSLSILPNLDEGFEHALVTTVSKSPVATCDQSPPEHEWQPTMNLILAIGMIIMILVSILTAYMEAMLYLKSQNSTNSHSTNASSSGSQSNYHNGKDYRRNNNHCSNQSAEASNKDRTNCSGQGANAISPSISSQQQQSASSSVNGASSEASYNALVNGKSGTLNQGSGPPNKQGNYGAGKSNSNPQKRRKNSSSVNANSEKVPSCSNNISSNKSSISSAASDKKTTSPYTPIFQNLTNVIASPPPPLPTFDIEFDPLEFKKFRGKRSGKKSNSLNGSIASNDDIANPNSLTNSQAHASGSSQIATNLPHIGKTPKTNGKSNSFVKLGATGIGYEQDGDQTGNLNFEIMKANSHNCKRDLIQDMSNSNSLSDDESGPSNNKLYKGVMEDRIKQANHQPTVMPIQPPSSLSSTPSLTTSSSSSTSSTSSSKSSSSSSSSSLKSSTSSTTSSTSSSPPLPTASSYGEYSLLGPGASFELPCLRVRSAQI